MRKEFDDIEDLLEKLLATQNIVDLLSKQGADDARALSMKISNLKKQLYVRDFHKPAITHIQSGKKAGKWKTYVGNPRKEVVRSTEQEIYDYLFDYYQEQNHYDPTYKDVFNEFVDYKVNQLNRSDRTESAYRVIFNRFTSEKIAGCKIAEITEDMVLEWVSSVAKNFHPKQEAFRKLIQQVNNVFDFGVRKQYCKNNPALYIDINCYLKDCDNTRKADEEKAFSEFEIKSIWESCMKDSHNPRALMALLAICTGMRAGELPVIHWTDIDENHIHIHRQQIRSQKNGSDCYFEVGYTKDERIHPHGGRRFPITQEIRLVLDLAKQLPGETGDYVFHDENGNAPTKGSYELYLRRLCRRLGIKTTNNHAFRMALNTRFIKMDMDGSMRALLLGHSMETNERHYSLVDSRRQDAADRILLGNG